MLGKKALMLQQGERIGCRMFRAGWGLDAVTHYVASDEVTPGMKQSLATKAIEAEMRLIQVQ